MIISSTIAFILGFVVGYWCALPASKCPNTCSSCGNAMRGENQPNGYADNGFRDRYSPGHATDDRP